MKRSLFFMILFFGISLFADELTAPLRTAPSPLAPALVKNVAAGNVEQVKHLVTGKSGIDSVDEDGTSALMWAAFKGDLELVEFLLVNGADVNASDKDGNRPLYFAASENHLKVAARLIDAGAVVNYHNRKQWSAVDIAKAKRFEQMVTLINERERLTKDAPAKVFPPQIYKDRTGRFRMLVQNTEVNPCLELQEADPKTPKKVIRSAKVCRFKVGKNEFALDRSQDVTYEKPTWNGSVFKVKLTYVAAAVHAATHHYNCEWDVANKANTLNCKETD